jgi:hypothetical protein
MKNTVEIENIEDMRLRQGINDVELREEVRRLRAGDFVKLTFLTGTSAYETVLIRITRITGSRFRGKLDDKLASARLLHRLAGTTIGFSDVHIHSVPTAKLNRDQ